MSYPSIWGKNPSSGFPYYLRYYHTPYNGTARTETLRDLSGCHLLDPTSSPSPSCSLCSFPGAFPVFNMHQTYSCCRAFSICYSLGLEYSFLMWLIPHHQLLTPFWWGLLLLPFYTALQPLLSPSQPTLPISFPCFSFLRSTYHHIIYFFFSTWLPCTEK